MKLPPQTTTAPVHPLANGVAYKYFPGGKATDDIKGLGDHACNIQHLKSYFIAYVAVNFIYF